MRLYVDLYHNPWLQHAINLYITWWSNKTGNDEVIFKASTDGGKTFSDKINLGNSPESDSQDVHISAAGSNVYISWWDRNAASNGPVLKVATIMVKYLEKR